MREAIPPQRAGVVTTVYEAAPAPRAEGAALSLWPNAIRALDRLGAGAAIRAAFWVRVAGGSPPRAGGR